LKEGVSYQVSVYHDDTASGRRLQRYRSYVWAPLRQTAQPSSRQDTVALPAFTGKFNFSNFQREIALGAADFPELAALDLKSDHVFLKVFTDPGAVGETIFLGRVTSAASLRIVASLPLAAEAIAYQIYGATFSIDGSIALTAN
jgi:hypothetical protein